MRAGHLAEISKAIVEVCNAGAWTSLRSKTLVIDFQKKTCALVKSASKADLGILRLLLDGAAQLNAYSEESNFSVNDLRCRIMQHIRQPIAGNFQLMPDLRLFIDKDLYLVKPMQRRFWLRSTALADADAIAGDLQQAIDIDARRTSA